MVGEQGDGDAGLGIYALRRIERGTFIGHYPGKCVATGATLAEAVAAADADGAITRHTMATRGAR